MLPLVNRIVKSAGIDPLYSLISILDMGPGVKYEDKKDMVFSGQHRGGGRVYRKVRSTWDAQGKEKEGYAGRNRKAE